MILGAYKIKFSLFTVENLLQHGLPERFSNGLQDRFERMSIISSHIFNDLRWKIHFQEIMNTSLELLGSEYLNDNSEEYDVGPPSAPPWGLGSGQLLESPGDHSVIDQPNDNQPKTDETTKFVASLVEQAADMSQSLWQKLIGALNIPKTILRLILFRDFYG